MKRLIFAAAMVAATAPVFAADVGVSINIGQPGFYGRIDIGDYPQPQLIYRQPVFIDQVAVGRPPIYLHVPPAHARHWKRFCHQYNACGERVYFVQSNWYNREYVPRYQQLHREHRGERREEIRREHREEVRQEHREEMRNERRGDDRGRGR